ncbi:MAG: metal ABC transporter ATP-binding protein [Fimbriimonadaceae bacterium]
MDEAAPPLEISDLTVAYGDKAAVWDLDMRVESGSLHGVMGPNGAGKSTVMKAAMGLLPTVAGTVRFFGDPLAKVRKRVGYVPQRGSVDWDFPTDALDVVTMGLYGKLGLIRRPKSKHREFARQCLDRVGLAEYEKRHISQLSGGQQQRVFLARALAQEADLYLMDEPFAGVDATTERTIIDVLNELRDQGKSAVIVHHDLGTVESYFDHATILNVRLVASGPIEQAFTAENLRAAYGSRLAFLEAK